MPKKPNKIETFSEILPSPEQTQLLRACLWNGEEGRKAWEAWAEFAENPVKVIKDDTKGRKRLMPLLLKTLLRNQASTDKPFMTFLRIAYTREDFRSKTFWKIYRSVMSSLKSVNSPVILLKGAALVDTVYTDRALRHCHDIDILFGDGDLRKTIDLLSATGFKSLNKTIGTDWGDLKFQHESGLPLELHRRLCGISSYTESFSQLWARSQIQIIGGIETRVLSPADSLLNVCGQAFSLGKRNSICWACDAWLIINHHPTLDWDLVLNCAQRYHVQLPLSVALGYLSEQLKSPIPKLLLDRLYSAASKNGIGLT